MENVTTKEAFLLAYWETYPNDKIFKIAEEINCHEAQKIMSQGLADHMGICTEEDKALFDAFGGGEDKAAEPLDSVILNTHGRLEEMVAKDYISKLSIEEAVALTRILRRTSYASFTLGGLDGVILDAEYIASRWSNTHRDSREEFMRKLEESLNG